MPYPTTVLFFDFSLSLGWLFETCQLVTMILWCAFLAVLFQNRWPSSPPMGLVCHQPPGVRSPSSPGRTISSLRKTLARSGSPLLLSDHLTTFVTTVRRFYSRCNRQPTSRTLRSDLGQNTIAAILKCNTNPKRLYCLGLPGSVLQERTPELVLHSSL